jgi:hypothetical protein
MKDDISSRSLDLARLVNVKVDKALINEAFVFVFVAMNLPFQVVEEGGTSCEKSESANMEIGDSSLIPIPAISNCENKMPIKLPWTFALN